MTKKAITEKGAYRRLATDDPYRLLALAALALAVEDARAGDPGAIGWLRAEGIGWLDALGVEIDPDYWQVFVDSGCKLRRKALQMPCEGVLV